MSDGKSKLNSWAAFHFSHPHLYLLSQWLAEPVSWGCEARCKRVLDGSRYDYTWRR